MKHKLKHTIAFLLVLINLLSLFPLETGYATNGAQVGDGGGNTTVTGSGTFDSTFTGYRLWLIDDSGNQVANVVDLRYTDPEKLNKSMLYLYNTKIQPYTGDSTVNKSKAKYYLFSELKGTFSSPLPRPVAKIGSGSYKGYGDELREWLVKDADIVQPTFSYSGTPSTGTYTYKGKQNTAVEDTPQQDSSGSSTSGQTQPSYATEATLASACSHIRTAANSRQKIIMANQSAYTRSQAYASICGAAQSVYDTLVASGHYSSTQIDTLTDTLRSVTDALDHELTYTGWKSTSSGRFGNGSSGGRGGDFSSDTARGGGFSTDASKALDSLFDTAYALDINELLNLEPIVLDIADIAYGADGATGTELTDKGNIYPLLNENDLFDFSDTGLRIMSINIDTIATNNLKLVIEPIVWFQPATVVSNGSGGWKIGTSPNYWFYGTPTTYASLMVWCKANGKWHDGGSGKGGWYSNVLNKVMSICLYLDEPLYINNESTKYIDKITPKNIEVLNTELSRSDLGYAMQYVMFGGASDLPSTQTYDNWSVDPNPTPHPAPDPDPTHPTEDKPYIPLSPGEPTEPGGKPTNENRNPEPEGYLNTTRNIHIVKVYDLLKIDGSIEHVTTLERDSNPGAIVVQHEPDYKCIGYFSSENYYGWDVEPVTEDLTWEEIAYNPYIVQNEEIQWESDFESVSEGKAGQAVATVKIGLYADPTYLDDIKDEENPRQANNGYDDSTLYVHLLKKETVPETSTCPTDPPEGSSPSAPPDPYNPNEKDPETDLVEEGNTYSHYRIVKVYETYDEDTDQLTVDVDYTRFPTNPIVYIEEEGLASKKDSYFLMEWVVSDDYKYGGPNSTQSVPNGTPWDTVISGISIKDSDTTVATVDLIDYEDVEKVVTLYVRYQRKINTTRVDGQIYIEQSQISKTISTDNQKVGGANWGKYKFIMTIGDFTPSHITYFNHGCCRGHKYCSTCHGHTCYLSMPGGNGDNQVTFVFDQTSAQDELEIKTGVNSQTDPKVYSKDGVHPKTVPSMFASGNRYTFTSDGKQEDGAEYVTVLWRGSSKYKDLPTLALYKKADITKYYSADNYNIPQSMLNNASKTSKKTRQAAPIIASLQFQFGVDEGASDLQATASCTGSGTKCIFRDTREYYPINGTQFVYDFQAKVAIQFYAGLAKGVANVSPTKVKFGNHLNNTAFVGTQEIKSYPYIRMTYMLNTIAEAEGEENNTHETGYNSDVRHDTYVLSEYESSILPYDAVMVGWYHPNNNDEETLLLTSQQWSLHQRAINNGNDWNGKNQVLPGGAIYQLSTPTDKLATVQIVTYQTVVDTKARNEYLSSTLTGDEYTESKVAKDHLDLVNDAKEVLDNLKVVQWVNKDTSASTAWPSRVVRDQATFSDAATALNGMVCLHGAGEQLSALNGLRSSDGKSYTMKSSANTDTKYYMRQQELETQAIYQSSTKLSDKTETLLKSGALDVKNETASQGDLDIINVKTNISIFKVFTDTSGNVYMAQVDSEDQDNAETVIKNAVTKMKDLNADSMNESAYSSCKVTKLFDKSVTAALANSMLTTGSDAKDIDDHTMFITNIMTALTRNKGDDPTAEWANGQSDGKWYNEAFDGIYLVRMNTQMQVGFKFAATRVSALDPALCPPNLGQSDLYTEAFLSQFCLDSHSDAAIAQGKANRYIGTFRGVDLQLPDMEDMYQSRKFYIPNANVQDLN